VEANEGAKVADGASIRPKESRPGIPLSKLPTSSMSGRGVLTFSTPGIQVSEDGKSVGDGAF
jgi:hypothetical protein